MKQIVISMISYLSGDVAKIIYNFYWPLLIFITTLIFKDEIKGLLNRIKKLSIKGVSIELETLVEIVQMNTIKYSLEEVDDDMKAFIKGEYSKINKVSMTDFESSYSDIVAVLVNLRMYSKETVKLFVAQKSIVDFLASKYINILGRDKLKPLDPSGYTTYGAYLFSENQSEKAKISVINEIKKSVEYKNKQNK